MRKFARIIPVLLSVIVLVSSVAAGPAPQQPNVTFTLIQGLPATMQIGESYTAVVQVTSDVPFLFTMALPTAYYPGARYVLASKGDRSRGGTTATLHVTFTAKGSTAGLPEGAAPVTLAAGARFPGGYTVTQRFDFLVTVP